MTSSGCIVEKTLTVKKCISKYKYKCVLAHTASIKCCCLSVDLVLINQQCPNNKVTTTHQVPVSLTHSERQRHFSFWPEWLDLWYGRRNHSQPVIEDS